MVSRSILLKTLKILFFKTLLRNLKMDKFKLSISEFSEKVLKNRILVSDIFMKMLMQSQ